MENIALLVEFFLPGNWFVNFQVHFGTPMITLMMPLIKISIWQNQSIFASLPRRNN